MLEKARSFLTLLRNSTDATALADDLLVFFYDLHDRYRIVRSSSPRFSAKSFAVLGDLIYNLESKPDETMKSEYWRNFIENLLGDIATGRIEIANK